MAHHHPGLVDELPRQPLGHVDRAMLAAGAADGDGQITGALAAQPGMKQTTYIKTNNVVRRLTPIECERLQGFPDNFTNIPWANKATAPDSRRYKALGNSMAVPVMRWIGKRIQESQPVVYNEEAIRNAMIKPLSQEEKETGQQSLF